MIKELDKRVLAYALENALLHEGKAQINAVLAKLFQIGLRKEDVKRVIGVIKKTVASVNKLTSKAQQKKFAELQKLVKRPKKKPAAFAQLPEAKAGKVILRFAPFPSGPLHIGNSRQAVLNDSYAKYYKGRLLLVIDDTIGSEEKSILPEAYKLIQDGLLWLEIKCAKVVYKSNRLETYYRYALELIKKGKAYVCFCPVNKLRKNRAMGIECKCRSASIEKNILNWGYMLSKRARAGEATLRIKTNMSHPNPAFRDRVLFRISDRTHPRTGKKYRVWPMLEFSMAIDDHLLGITHIIRGKELEIETKMEKLIWDTFYWPHPVVIPTGLLSIEGVKLSKSKSREEVLSGLYRGWDDPRTWSLQSLQKRGIQPAALRKFCMVFGLTKTDTKAPLDILYTENKKIIEKNNRYFFVQSPVQIKIEKAPALTAKIPLHPDYPGRGNRALRTAGKFHITEDDFKTIRKSKEGAIYRLMNLFNFVKKGNKLIFRSIAYNPKLKAMPIHWLPAQGLVNAKVLMLDGSYVKGLAEPSVKKLKIGTVIQFERFAFCCLQGKNKRELEFWWTHR